jgi:two-component system, OmpR family, copper resistance phosphate regulon response regulator CusR
VAFDGKTGLSLALENNFDLIVLDIMLPEINGYEVCKEIRRKDQLIPVIFLSALGTSENIVMGLEYNADDYIVKPFKFVELLARIRNLLRRTENTSTPKPDLQEEFIYKIDDLVVNDYTKTVVRNSQEISLTTTEYKLLLFFIKNKERVLSRPDILDEVWGVSYELGTNVVDVYVNYLRKKIDSQSNNKLIQTMIGMGYVMK